MKYERWLIPETDDAAVEALMDAGYPYLVSTVLGFSSSSMLGGMMKMLSASGHF